MVNRESKGRVRRPVRLRVSLGFRRILVSPNGGMPIFSTPIGGFPSYLLGKRTFRGVFVVCVGCLVSTIVGPFVSL